MAFDLVVKGGNPMWFATNVFLAFTEVGLAWIEKVINSPAVDPSQFGSADFVEEYTRRQSR